MLTCRVEGVMAQFPTPKLEVHIFKQQIKLQFPCFKSLSSRQMFSGNIPNCYNEGLLTESTPRCDCFFNIFADTLHTWSPSPPTSTRGPISNTRSSTRTRSAVSHNLTNYRPDIHLDSVYVTCVIFGSIKP